MRRYITLSCPALVVFSLLVPVIPCIVLLVFFCAEDSSNKISNIVGLMLTIALWISILFLFFHRAFTIVIFTQEGIRNKYVRLKFEDIGSVSSINVRLWEYSFTPICFYMICIGKQKDFGTFFTYDKRKCILLPMNEKTLRKLGEFSNKKSQLVQDFIKVRGDCFEWKKREKFLDKW